MKFISTVAFFLLLTTVSGQSSSFFQTANTFLKEHVQSGLIEYEKIKNDPTVLNVLVRQIANYLIAGKTPEQQKAFYTNAYNILVIKQ
ncbi:MAG: hypothetical protein RJQ14_05830, partial [Marinoscillum sp.]